MFRNEILWELSWKPSLPNPNCLSQDTAYTALSSSPPGKEPLPALFPLRECVSLPYPQGARVFKVADPSDLITCSPLLINRVFKPECRLVFQARLQGVLLRVNKRLPRKHLTLSETSHCPPQMLPDGTESDGHENWVQSVRNRNNDTLVPGAWAPTIMTRFSLCPGHQPWFVMAVPFTCLLHHCIQWSPRVQWEDVLAGEVLARSSF